MSLVFNSDLHVVIIIYFHLRAFLFKLPANNTFFGNLLHGAINLTHVARKTVGTNYVVCTTLKQKHIDLHDHHLFTM